jgi:hypothetical protein
MRIVAVALLLAASGLGCASPNKIERGAWSHLDRAQYLEAQGDYYGAERERAAADRQFAKARTRAYNEAVLGIYRY